MNLKDLIQNAKNLTGYEFGQKLNQLVRNNYRYRNLGEENRRLIMDIIKKYKPYLRQGIGLSYSQRQRESYKLYQNRAKLGLTEEDLKDIKEVLNSLAK